MSADSEPIKRPIKQALLGFLLTLVVLLALLFVSVNVKYIDDFSRANLSSFDLLKVILLQIISTLPFALPLSILAMSAFYYRYRQGQNTLMFKNGLSVSLSVSIACFIWVGFVNPANNVHMIGLIYDIQQKDPNEPLQRTDLSFFRTSPISRSYFVLGRDIDSLETAAPYSSKGDNEYFRITAEKDIQNIRYERSKMVGFPILVFLLFYCGMFLGILFRNIKLAYLPLTIFFTAMPVLYLPINMLDRLAWRGQLSPFLAQFLLLFGLMIAGYALFVIAKRHLGKSENITGEAGKTKYDM